MPRPVEKVVSAFRSVVVGCSPVDATVLSVKGADINMVTTWSQRNVERKVNMMTDVYHTVNMLTKQVNSFGSADATTQLLTSYSPSRTFKGVLRELPAAGKVPKKQYIEVWKENVMWKQFDLHSFELHGDVHTDSTFGCLEWSPCEEQLLYVAEKKLPKTESFLSPKTDQDKVEPGNEYLYVEEWGEALIGRSTGVLAVADLTRDEVRLVAVDDDEVEGLSLGSGVWAPGGASGGYVAIAYETRPRRLGKVFCSNRFSWVVHITPDKKLEKLSKDGMAVVGVQFSPDQSRLVWLEREATGPHDSCLRLVCFNWATHQRKEVVPVVEESMTCAGGQVFYGLYKTGLPKCWLADSKTVVLSSLQRITVNTYAINTDTCEVHEIGASGSEEYSQGVLAVTGDHVVCWQSCLTSHPGVVVAKVVTDSLDCVKWVPLKEMRPILEDYTVTVLPLQADTPSPSEPAHRRYCALYLGPRRREGVPLVVWSHGGPHSAFSNTYSMEAHFFAKLGFGMVMVNYRGSLGYGEVSVRSLLGGVGRVDVSDVHAAQQAALKHSPALDPTKTVLFGGSHGGFLTLHLAGQYPAKYRCAVALNPVTDLSAFSSSDIPDWAYSVSGLKYTSTSRVTGEQMERMYEASPMRYVDQVKVPVLLLVGRKDLRVPPSQALNYYHALQAHGNHHSKVLVYDDNHSLRQSVNETDFLINTALWFIDNTDHVLD